MPRVDTRPKQRPHLHKPDGKATDVRRDEFTEMSDSLRNVHNVTRDEFIRAINETRENVHQLEVQFRRIAQMQADIDLLKATVSKLTAPLPKARSDS